MMLSKVVSMSRLSGRLVAVVGLLVVLLSACSTSGGPIEWRDADIALPAGWIEIDRSENHLLVGDGLPPEEPGTRGELDVAMQVTVEPGTTADDWRRFVVDEGATLEVDEAISVGGAPATMIQFSFTTNGVPTRERVIVIPSRQLVLLQQPVPLQTDTDGPERFLERLEEFDALLDGISFGAPEGYLDGDR